MAKPTQKEIEAYYFAKFKNYYSLPIGDIVHGDRPDFILYGERKIGIEVTSFYLTDGKSFKSEQYQEQLRELVVSKAQSVYSERNGTKNKFEFGFDKDNPIIKYRNIANKIVKLVERINGSGETGLIRRDVFQEIPELSSVYLHEEEYEDAKWRVGKTYTGLNMCIERLKEIIEEKEVTSKKYEKCDVYWLLVIVEFMDPAQDQNIQIDAPEKISSDVFEKIIVYKPAFQQVLEVQ